jgi:hypothetical protein
MVIESKRDEVTAAFPRTQAEALLVAAADGLAIIDALDMIRITATTERAIETLRTAVLKRGATVSATFTRVEAAALEKAVDVGLRVVSEFPLERNHDLTAHGLAKLNAAIRPAR